MEEQSVEQDKDTQDRKLVGEGVKFEHYQRACCRVVGNPETFPTALREEVRDRVKHT